jgi:hypothetical protein
VDSQSDTVHVNPTVPALKFVFLPTTSSSRPCATQSLHPLDRSKMIRSAPQTWLEKSKEQYQYGKPIPGTKWPTANTVNVDIDWMDSTYSKNLPIKPNDQTINNSWVDQQMSHPENKDMVLQVCKELKSEGWKAAYTRIVSYTCGVERAVLIDHRRRSICARKPSTTSRVGCYFKCTQTTLLTFGTSFVTAKGAMATGEHGCHSATISPEVLNELAKLQYDGMRQPGEGKPKPSNVYAGYKTPERLLKVSKIDPLQAADIDSKLASTDIDCLANNGEELQKEIKANPITSQRLDDPLTLFTGGLILESKAKIQCWFQEV